MKKISILLILIIYIGIIVSIPTNAENSMYTKGLTYLQNHGFDQKMINLMSYEEICEYSDAIYTETETINYYFPKNSDNQLIIESMNSNNSIDLCDSNVQLYDWLSLRISTTLIGNDYFVVYSSFEWKTNPLMRLKDVFAITFPNNLIPNESTGIAKFCYDDASGTLQEIDYSSLIQYCNGGIYVMYDLPFYFNNDLYGYMSTRATLNIMSNDSSVNFSNYAYYAHQIFILIGDASVSFPASISFSITPENSFDIAAV